MKNIFIVLLFHISLYANNECHQTSASLFHNFINGSISGAAGMIVYAPFHYFQNRKIQKLPIDWKKPSNWFRGTPALALGKAPTMGVQIASYESIAKIMKKNNAELSTIQKTIAALFAGSLSGIVNNFTHLIALHQENKGGSFIKNVKQLPPERIKNLNRGLGTTISRELLFTNVFLVFLKDLKEKIYKKTNNSTFAHISSGLFSGLTIAGTTQPFMVVTAKLYADMEKKHYKNGFDAAHKIFTENGIRGFYQGSLYRSMGVILALPVFDYVQEKLSPIFSSL